MFRRDGFRKSKVLESYLPNPNVPEIVKKRGGGRDPESTLQSQSGLGKGVSLAGRSNTKSVHALGMTAVSGQTPGTRPVPVGWGSIDRSEVKRETSMVSLVFSFKQRVDNDLITVNPLGLAITCFREDRAFQ